MLVYRITTANHASGLTSPGVAGRWNTTGTYVIYSSFSRSLACLENIVHRSSSQLMLPFRCMVIDLPDGLDIETATADRIGLNWFSGESLRICQEIGNKWIIQGRTCILKVPSAVVPKEFNFVLNTAHPDFRKITIQGIEDFEFDKRLRPS